MAGVFNADPMAAIESFRLLARLGCAPGVKQRHSTEGEARLDTWTGVN
jgi:hypothetical protein